MPGQFVHVLVGSTNDPLLRRPLSIHDVDSGRIVLLYEVRGRGTALLAEKREGESVDLIGPLGNGFTLPTSADQPVLIIGGGIGAAPLKFLTRVIAEKYGKSCLHLLTGARSMSGHICHDEFCSFCEDDDKYRVCTDDGSFGVKGVVTDLLNPWLDELSSKGDPIIYACGPTPMLKAVSAITKARGLKCQVSLEAKMACGVGACMGCVIKVRDGDSTKYVRCCKEGPVFDADEVVWD